MKSADWDQRFADAQAVTSYRIDGQEYPRIRYGDETHAFAGWHLDDQGQPRPCHDCAVPVGTFHLPGCDGEECPRCGWQAISCDCPDDDAEEGEDDAKSDT